MADTQPPIPPPGSSSSPSLLGGVIDDRYRIDAYLGEGAMGAVFRATQVRLQRTVALKIPLPHFMVEAEYRARFEREALATARLTHKNIVAIHDVSVAHKAGQISYLVLEFVEGKTLDHFFRQEQEDLLVRDVIDLFAQIAAGLQAAHEQGIVHRDIKPANILVTQPDRVAKILDFGVARMEDALGATRTGSHIGTPLYMAPELIAGEGEVTPAVDVYALAMTAYRELVRAPAFDAPGVRQLLHAQLMREPRQPSAQNPALPGSVDAVICRGLAKAADERPASAPEFIEDLRRAFDGYHDTPWEAMLPEVDRTPPPEETPLPIDPSSGTRLARFVLPPEAESMDSPFARDETQTVPHHAGATMPLDSKGDSSPLAAETNLPAVSQFGPVGTVRISSGEPPRQRDPASDSGPPLQGSLGWQTGYEPGRAAASGRRRWVLPAVVLGVVALLLATTFFLLGVNRQLRQRTQVTGAFSAPRPVTQTSFQLTPRPAQQPTAPTPPPTAAPPPPVQQQAMDFDAELRRYPEYESIIARGWQLDPLPPLSDTEIMARIDEFFAGRFTPQTPEGAYIKPTDHEGTVNALNLFARVWQQAAASYGPAALEFATTEIIRGAGQAPQERMVAGHMAVSIRTTQSPGPPPGADGFRVWLVFGFREGQLQIVGGGPPPHVLGGAMVRPPRPPMNRRFPQQR